MATNPKPVKPSINPRSPDFTDCFSPVFGNSCLDLVVVSCGRELVDPLVLVDADVLTEVLVLIVSEEFVLVDRDVLTDPLVLVEVDVLALVEADSDADWLALVDADSEADWLALVEADSDAD